MGHAGAIVSGGSGTAQEKMARFQDAGIPVARTPSEIPVLIANALRAKRKSKLTLLRPKRKAGSKVTRRGKPKKASPARRRGRS
jgi:hypothetical protein